MKKSWRVMAIVAALLSVFGGAAGAMAQNVPIAGGYGDASTTDAEVVAAARFAVKAEGRKTGAPVALLSIERAELQVVAGLNYRLQLKVKTRGKTEGATAVVYKNLKRQYSLTSWEADTDKAGGASASAGSTIEQFVKTLADAYTAKNMGSLDAAHPYVGRVRIVITHSLADERDKGGVESRWFRTLATADAWLRSREHEELPSRQLMPLKRCWRGLCTFNFDGGILHNQLYLQKISYGLRNGKPYIKTISLLDGD